MLFYWILNLLSFDVYRSYLSTFANTLLVTETRKKKQMKTFLIIRFDSLKDHKQPNNWLHLPDFGSKCGIKVPARLLVKVLPFSKHFIKNISERKEKMLLDLQSLDILNWAYKMFCFCFFLKSWDVPLFLKGVESLVASEIGTIVSSRLERDWVDKSWHWRRELE